MIDVDWLSPPDPGPFATPRPDMRGRYLIRSATKARAMALLDGALRLVPVRRPAASAAVERILVANWGHLGDVVTTYGAIALLRRRHPAVRIGMIVGSWGAPAARSSGLIDTIHVIDHWAVNRSGASRSAKLRHYRRSRAAALTDIRAAGYDVAIDFYAFFPPAHPIFHRAGIPVRVGFDSGGLGPLLTHAVRWQRPGRPIADHYRDLLEAAWPDRPILPDEVRPRLDAGALPPLPAAVSAAGRYIVLHPGAGAPYKDWGADNWRALIGLLRAEPRSLVLTGAGTGEVAVARALAAHHPAVIDLAGGADWATFAAVLAGAELIVCPDTATSHLGAALDTPVVSIFTGANDPREWGPYSANARVLLQSVWCTPCNLPGCNAMGCIRQTRPADVARAIDALLAGRAAS